jgi:ferrous iron transport protein A
MIIKVNEMKPNQTGMVTQIQGGHNLAQRLETMGILPGTNIKKKSAQPLQGPVIIHAGRTELALGFGMAQRILVEVCE